MGTFPKAGENIKKINICEIAKRAGVSKSTVSRVINNSPGTSETAKKKVSKVIEELKYRPNISARYLRKRTNNLIGILISADRANDGIVSLVNSRKINGIVKKVRDFDYDVLTFIEDVSDTIRLKDIIIEKGLSGILLLDQVPVAVLETLNSYSVPFVLVNWYDPGYEKQCFVRTDLIAATVSALEFLVIRGYRDIGVINWEDSRIKSPVIESAYNSFMKDNGLDFNNSVLNTTFSAPYDELTQFIKKTQKRAYISFSYVTSMDILSFCRAESIRIPQDLALISYDYFDFYDYVNPKLTGIEQKSELMGEKATEKLIGLISGKAGIKNEFIKPNLIIRDSC